jgi:ribosome-associated translation inhibitor RaiA
MDMPLEISFHNLHPSSALEAAIRERADRLEHLYQRLTSCRVSVEAPHRHHRKGSLLGIHIELGVPGGTLAVSREPHHAEKYAAPNVYKTLRDAFDAAERQLLEYKQRLNGDIKQHDGARPQGEAPEEAEYEM